MEERKAYIQLHIAVLLFGFTAILGELIQLSGMVLVWWRMLLTWISLLFLPRIFEQIRLLPRPFLRQMLLAGGLVALHWVCFYGSIKASNVSITLCCMGTTSLFTSFTEPWLLKQRIKWHEVLLGSLVIPGMYLIFRFARPEHYEGIVLGLLAALLAAIFPSINKKLIDQKCHPYSMTLIELGSGWLLLCALMPLYWQLESAKGQFWPSSSDWAYLLVLALLCTSLAYILSLRALEHLSAFASTLAINLEPIYGIALAIVLLNEDKELNAGIYAGMAIILLSVFSHPFVNRWRRRQAQRKA